MAVSWSEYSIKRRKTFRLHINLTANLWRKLFYLFPQNLFFFAFRFSHKSSSLGKYCPCSELLVHISPHLDWIRRFTEYISLFSPNMRKSEQKNSKQKHFSLSALNPIKSWISVYLKNAIKSWISVFRSASPSSPSSQIFKKV